MTAARDHSSSDASWREQAACVGHDPRLFTDPRPDTSDTARALAICRGCPVRKPCLTDALAYPADADPGIRGATTETDRQQLRRHTPRTRRDPHTAPAPVSSDAAAAGHGLFPTADGELTDLTGRAQVIGLPDRDQWAVFIDRRLVLRTDSLPAAWRHIAGQLDELQPDRTAPYTLTPTGELAHPDGRTLITRLPTPPHLLVVVDGHPMRRATTIGDACRHTQTAGRPMAGVRR